MRKIIKNSVPILCSLLLLFSMPACSGFLDIDPDYGVYKEDVEGIAAAEAMTRGLYIHLQSSSYYGLYMFYYGDLRADDIRYGTSGSDANRIYRYEHNTPDNVAGLSVAWSAPYALIRSCNELIQYVESGKASDGTVAQMNNVLGQALAIRALAYFDIVRIYGWPYLDNSRKTVYGKNWGAALTTDVLDYKAKLQRNTVDETYEFIVNDLERAIALISPTRVNGQINSWAAKALLVRVYMTTGEWNKAFAYASDIIENSGYSLIPANNYVASWSLEYTTESLFSIPFSTTTNLGRSSLSYQYTRQPVIFPTNGVTELMLGEPNDVRLGIMTISTSQTTGKVVSVILKKYPGRDNAGYINNMPVLRLSEMYLSAAEAALKKTPASLDSASLYLNALRQQRNLSSVVPTQERILTERRKELLGEGQRFFDVIRLGLQITRPELANEPNALPTVDWTQHKILLPIDRGELDVNPDIYQTYMYGR